MDKLLETLISSAIEKEKEPVDKEMDELYTKFARLFTGSNCDDELYSYLKEIDITTNQVCAKKLLSSGAWSCKDCEMDSTCIMCNDCYENSKEKHKGHKVSFKLNTTGCCDCGDPDAWKPSGFCSKHQGTFSTEKEITRFINQSFNIRMIATLQSILIEMIKRMIVIINIKPVISIVANSHLNMFITFLTRICEANQALLHIVAELFICNYPFSTDHQCFKLTPSSVEIATCDTQDKESHQCCCCFIQILFQIFGTASKHEQFLYLLLKNYRIKLIMGLSLFCSFDVLFKNNCSTIQDFSVQIITEEVAEMMFHSPKLMNYIADKLYEIIKDSYATNTNFHQVLLILLRFYYDMVYLLKPKALSLLKNHLYFYKRILDIIGLFHNSVVLTEATSFQKEIFTEADIKVEVYLLELFSLLITVFDFSNTEDTNNLFDYFIDLFKEKKLKQLNRNEYSFHISSIRAFSIFLTHYCFSYALTNKIDTHLALRTILKGKDFNFEQIINEVIKGIGFITSTKLRFWIYYGETAMAFNIIYQHCQIFPLCDFSLIKLVCSLPQYSNLVSIDNIFLTANVYNSYDKLNNLLIEYPEQADQIDLEWSKEKNSKNILLGQQLIIVFTNILRMSDYLINLLYFSYEDIMKNKVVSDIHQLFDLNERKSIDDYLISKLVQVIISNDNYCLYSVITKELSPLLGVFKSDNETMAMINGCLEKNKGISKEGVRFSLKPQYHSLIDLSLLLEGDKVSQAERYITEFKKKEINILQTVNKTPILNCIKDLQKEYEANFYSIHNTKWLLLFFAVQLSNSNWESIQRYYLFNTMRLIKIMIAISQNGNEKLIESINLLHDKRDDIISLMTKPLSSIDDLQKEYIAYVMNEVVAFTHYSIPSSVDTIGKDITDKEEPHTNKIKTKKEEMLSKYREKFKEKNKQFQANICTQIQTTLISDNTNNNDSTMNESTITDAIKSNESDSNVCVICRVSIDSNGYYKTPYGRFGIIVNDFFIRNMQIQTMKRAFNEDDVGFSSEMTFGSFIKQDPQFKKKKKQKRILTCNHFVHFSCYEEFVTQTIKQNEKTSFQCPFCKLYSNICIPMLNITQSDTITKGISLKEGVESFNSKQLASFGFQLKEELAWQNPIHRFLEDLLSINQKQTVLVTDLNKNTDVLMKVYSTFVDYLKHFFVFYENYSNEQISLMNTVICALRILVKTNYIQPMFLFERFFTIVTEVYQLDTPKNSEGSEFTEALLLFMILFDGNDDEASILIILQLFLPSIFVNMFISDQIKQHDYKLTPETCMTCLTNVELGKYINSDQAKLSFNSYLRKVVICKRIMSNVKPLNNTNDEMSLDFLSKYNSNLDELNLSSIRTNPLMSLLNLKYPSYWLKGVNPYDAINSILSSIIDKAKIAPIAMIPSYYSLGMEFRYHFIDLPSNILELVSSMNNKQCIYCSKLSCFSIICLTCGKKMCYTTKCLVHNSKDTSVGFYSFIYHGEICGGGNSVFIPLDTGEFIFLTKRMIIKMKMFAYLNQFGEEPGKNDISSDYQLSQSNLDKAKNMFISFSYRKTASESSILDILGLEPDFDSDIELD